MNTSHVQTLINVNSVFKKLEWNTSLWSFKLRSSAGAKIPRDASCHWIFCWVTQGHLKWHAWPGMCTSLNDLQWPFKVMIIQRQITSKWYMIELYLQWSTNRKSYMVYLTAPLSMRRHSLTLNISNEILIWTSTSTTQQCHFEWSWVT